MGWMVSEDREDEICYLCACKSRIDHDELPCDMMSCTGWVSALVATHDQEHRWSQQGARAQIEWQNDSNRLNAYHLVVNVVTTIRQISHLAHLAHLAHLSLIQPTPPNMTFETFPALELGEYRLIYLEKSQ